MLSAIHEIQKLEGFEEADKLVKERRYGEAVEKFGKLLAEVRLCSCVIRMRGG